MKEMRHHRRHVIQSTIQIINVLDGESMGVLINLSEGGFMAMGGPNSPKRGDVLQLQLLETSRQLLDIQLGVTCVWQEPAHAADSFWYGCKFIDLAPEARTQLQNYLSRLD